jgi:hypothetical protein
VQIHFIFEFFIFDFTFLRNFAIIIAFRHSSESSLTLAYLEFLSSGAQVFERIFFL